MQVAIFGGTGMLGLSVAKFLQINGFNVDIISRKPEKYLNKKKYQGLNIINKLDLSKQYNICINLAGLSIFRRWANKNKQELLNSRTCFFDSIIEYSNKCNSNYNLIINGSAIGFYGSSNEVLDESAKLKINNNIFSQFLCNEVEEEATKLQKVSNQIINIRTGVVMEKNNGFLKRILPSFKMGLGSIIGNGKQFISWIDITDFCRAILFIIENQHKFNKIDYVNLTTPNFATNKEFSQILAKCLHRPCIFKMPSFIVKLLFGQMGIELMLGSQKIYPKKLMEAGFNFLYTTLEESIVRCIK